MECDASKWDNSDMMATNQTKPWLPDRYSSDLDDFVEENSRTEYSSYIGRFVDSLTPVKSVADIILTGKHYFIRLLKVVSESKVKLFKRQ